MGRITSTQAIFFSPGTNWAGGRRERGKKQQKTKTKVGWPMGNVNTVQETQQCDSLSKMKPSTSKCHRQDLLDYENKTYAFARVMH